MSRKILVVANIESRHCQLYSLVLGAKNHFSSSKINLVQHVDVLDETPKTCINV